MVVDRLIPLCLLGLLLAGMAGCEASAVKRRHTGEAARAVRSADIAGDPEAEYVDRPAPHPLAVVELPNRRGESPKVQTIVDPLLGRNKPAAPPATPTPVGGQTETEVRVITTAPAPFSPSRGNVDSTATQP